MTTSPQASGRRTQADRRARTRSALVEAAARGFSTYGFANVVLEDVANAAGYTRGALYHVFTNKEELALAVVQWVGETWNAEVGAPAAKENDPVAALLAIAHGHVIFCRRDVARVLLSLRVEFAGQDHPVGRAITETIERLDAECAALITAGRASGAIPPGPPARVLGEAFTAIIEAVGIELTGQMPHDVDVVDRVTRGLLGLPPGPAGRHPSPR